MNDDVGGRLGANRLRLRSTDHRADVAAPMKLIASLALILALASTGGCAVVAVVDTAATIAVKTVGVAADAAVGTAKIVGRGVGKAADAVVGSDKDGK